MLNRTLILKLATDWYPKIIYLGNRNYHTVHFIGNLIQTKAMGWLGLLLVNKLLTHHDTQDS